MAGRHNMVPFITPYSRKQEKLDPEYVRIIKVREGTACDRRHTVSSVIL